MNMRKLLSIGALTLAIVSCTSMTTFAAEVVPGGSRTEAAKAVIKNALKNTHDDFVIIHGIKVNTHTEIGEYLNSDFITEIQKEVDKFWSENNISSDKPTITSEDTYFTLQTKFAVLKGLSDDQKQKAFLQIKSYTKAKLTAFENASKASNAELIKVIKDHFVVDGYGTLTIGRNMNNATTVTLEEKNTKRILAQISTEEVYEAKNKLSGIEDYGQLLDLLEQYFPNIRDQIAAIK